MLSIRPREREGVMPITLAQQTALSTGASRGIGRGIALKLAEQGVKRIAINYKENDAAAEEAARLLKERGAAPLVIKADIGKVADIQRMFETIKSQFGGLDIFVSNARATIATGFYAEPMEIPLQAWQATFDTQATEFLVAVRAAVPMMGLGVPADVGNAVVLLCTDQASFITGQLLYVDGGASAMDPVFPLAIQGIK